MYHLVLILDQIMVFIQKHKTEMVGTGGGIVTLLAPYMEFLSLLGQAFAGFGGATLLSLSIYIKAKQAQDVFNKKKSKNDSETD